MLGPEIERLIQLLAKLPGLGPRSARRAVLHLLARKDALMAPLATALGEAAARITACSTCGNLDTADPCGICADPRRDAGSASRQATARVAGRRTITRVVSGAGRSRSQAAAITPRLPKDPV